MRYRRPGLSRPPASPVSSDSANSGAMWHEALAMFANDLRSATGTEEMRTAVQHYRAFWSRLEDSPYEV
ncbi:MAG: hypothetical protein QOJ73_4584 [Streptosporangiaceae bacterium]|jgi:hypothetical protein|nr:hypothetical protein [Streptosporangiaceae bacterium]